MVLHLIKVSVGSQSMDELVRWQRKNRVITRKGEKKQCVYHTTFHEPKRKEELLEGGSLYWVIKKCILGRQKLLGFDKGLKEDGSPCCLILLEPKIHFVKPFAYKPFQGWRYLEEVDAPPDLSLSSERALSQLPENMRRALAELCLL